MIAGFLGTKTDPDFLANVHLEAATAPQIAHGKQLVTEMGCAVCHEINGIHRPEDFAPDLTAVGVQAAGKNRLRAGHGADAAGLHRKPRSSNRAASEPH